MSELEQINKKADRAVLTFSGGASSGRPIHKSNPGLIEIAFTNNPSASSLPYWYSSGVPVIINDFEKFYEKAGQKNLRDMTTRRAYDELSLTYIDKLIERNGLEEPDFVIASGYMKLVTDAWLNRFPSRMLNVHPAELYVLNKKGRRKYTGDRAVKKAIKAGEAETRSVIHLMNDQADQGPILVRSKPLPVEGLTDDIRGDKEAFNKFCDEHQEKMKDECDVPAFLYAIELMQEHHIETDGKVIVVNGKQYPKGVEVGEV